MGKKPTAYIAEFPIFKQQEFLAPRDVLQLSDSVFGEVIDDVCVGFENTYGVADFFCEGEQVVGGVDVGGYAEIRSFDGN